MPKSLIKAARVDKSADINLIIGDSEKKRKDADNHKKNNYSLKTLPRTCPTCDFFTIRLLAHRHYVVTIGQKYIFVKFKGERKR